MLFPIIKVIDNDSKNKAAHIVGTNSHDALVIDKPTGGIHYLNLQCCESTRKYTGEGTFSFVGEYNEYSPEPLVEMVTFQELCELYIAQTKQSCEEERALRELIKQIITRHDEIVKENGLDMEDGFRNTGGTLY